MRGQKEWKSQRIQVPITRQHLLDMQVTASMKSQYSCLKKTCIRTALVDMLTQTEETSQSPSLDEELLAHWLWREGESIFSRHKSAIGYPIPSGQPHTCVYVSSIKWT